ncbi:hypothetical protein SADUNF_Sadunf12G0071200 [Salix dunnii]|uniref:Wbp11/ELF5/Saf1 N-terminal domain-containing protein n=1 Tax=Salix dunnii TaxID=1413687 RepID=A0A835JRF3_9ROSI|nr:hypothetical protein SADUNF_Sadunf12G0071200 [Salix dunnii]
MKTTKGGKVMNPTDAYRKELRKKELKRNKKERKKVREVGILKKDPVVIKDQIEKLELMKADGALDKARKHKKRQLEDTLSLVLKKRRVLHTFLLLTNCIFVFCCSHLGPLRRTSAEEEERAKHPKPEDSVYYHPTLNPTGAPPPGKPPMYKSTIGPRIPLSGASSSATESEDVALTIPPPLPESGELGPGDSSAIPASLPLPPPPPMPPKPAASSLGMSLPPPPLPLPPPGPPPKDQVLSHTPLPPPPPLQQSAQPPPPGTNESGRETNISALLDEPSSNDTVQVSASLPPPPPIAMPLKSSINQTEGASFEGDANTTATTDNPKMVPPPPPSRQQPLAPGPALMPTLQPDVLPPGITRFPPPPPPPPLNMQPPLSTPGIPSQMAPPGLTVPFIPRPPYGPPPGPPPMMRPPLPPGPPPFQEDVASRPSIPQKPSYIKSAASTVVKRPLAQHTPELTAMIPASVRVRREAAIPKPKPKAGTSTTAVATRPTAPTTVKPESTNSSSAPKSRSIDDSYMAFLEDMKTLGALDG